MAEALILQNVIEKRILIIHGHNVMMDSDLALLYEVSTKMLVQAVKRNIKRFPRDFMFQLTEKEFIDLRSQFVTSKRGGRRYPPYVFTEQGVAMLSSVLNSERAIQVNIAIMRVFVKFREVISNHKELVVKLDELDQKIEKHDEEIKAIFDVIRQLMAPIPEEPRRRIGFGND